MIGDFFFGIITPIYYLAQAIVFFTLRGRNEENKHTSPYYRSYFPSFIPRYSTRQSRKDPYIGETVHASKHWTRQLQRIPRNRKFLQSILHEERPLVLCQNCHWDFGEKSTRILVLVPDCLWFKRFKGAPIPVRGWEPEAPAVCFLFWDFILALLSPMFCLRGFRSQCFAWLQCATTTSTWPFSSWTTLICCSHKLKPMKLAGNKFHCLRSCLSILWVAICPLCCHLLFFGVTTKISRD